MISARRGHHVEACSEESSSKTALITGFAVKTILDRVNSFNKRAFYLYESIVAQVDSAR